jgi:hypothetical protein
MKLPPLGELTENPTLQAIFGITSGLAVIRREPRVCACPTHSDPSRPWDEIDWVRAIR